MADFNRKKDRDNDNGPGGAGDAGKKVFFRRSRACPLTGPKAPKIDYKDIKLLNRFVSERGKIMPRRITSVCAKKQRELARAVKRARMIALLPFAKN